MESWEEKAESAEDTPDSLLQVFSLLWQLFSFTRSKLLEIPESTWLSSSDRLQSFSGSTADFGRVPLSPLGCERGNGDDGKVTAVSSSVNIPAR